MKFNKDEVNKDIETGGFSLLPPGNYDAEVLECEDTVSKKGSPMFKLTLGIVDGNGTRHKVWDYISPHFFQHKFKHFFQSMGKIEMFESGDIDPALLLNQYVTAEIEIKPAQGEYGENNAVVDYIPAEENAMRKLAASAPPIKDSNDGLPF